MVLKVQKSEDNYLHAQYVSWESKTSCSRSATFCPKHNFKPWIDVGKILCHIKEVQKG